MWRAKQARLSHRVDRVGSLSLRVNCPLPPAQLTCRRRQVSSARKSPPTVFSRMRTNRIRHAISLSPTGGVYNAVLAGKALLYPHRRVGRCNVRRGESKSRCSKATEERILRSQSASSSHFSLSAVRTRLFLHLAQRTPVATTLCSCMIAGESAGLKHVKRNPPHRVLLTTTLHALSPMPPISAPVAKAIYQQDSNGLCASSYPRPCYFCDEFPCAAVIGEFSCCGLTRSLPFTECAPSG
jgi:hypothetical protein